MSHFTVYVNFITDFNWIWIVFCLHMISYSYNKVVSFKTVDKWAC